MRSLMNSSRRLVRNGVAPATSPNSPMKQLLAGGARGFGCFADRIELRAGNPAGRPRLILRIDMDADQIERLVNGDQDAVELLRRIGCPVGAAGGELRARFEVARRRARQRV